MSVAALLICIAYKCMVLLRVGCCNSFHLWNTFFSEVLKMLANVNNLNLSVLDTGSLEIANSFSDTDERGM